MADPNSCKPPLIKIWTVFNCTTRFRLYHNARSLQYQKHECAETSALNYLFKSTAWKNFSCERRSGTRDEQTEPRHHTLSPYKICPLSLVFWQTMTKQVLISVRLFTSDHPAVQKAATKGNVHVPTGWDPYAVKGLCLLLRDKHKGRLYFHPWGDNSACHRATYPAQHLCHTTGDEACIFLQGMRINQRRLADHRGMDDILFQSTSSEGEQEKLLEHDSPGMRLCLACLLIVGFRLNLPTISPRWPHCLV